jgi:hypothetical protein
LHFRLDRNYHVIVWNLVIAAAGTLQWALWWAGALTHHPGMPCAA